MCVDIYVCEMNFLFIMRVLLLLLLLLLAYSYEPIGRVEREAQEDEKEDGRTQYVTAPSNVVHYLSSSHKHTHILQAL